MSRPELKVKLSQLWVKGRTELTKYLKHNFVLKRNLNYFYPNKKIEF